MKPLLKHVVLFLVVIISSFSFGQKDAPVVGDAIKLVQLLGKDYAAVSPELRQEEIIRDRATIIATFKSYMTKQELADFNAHFDTAQNSNLAIQVAENLETLLDCKKDLETAKNIAGQFSTHKEATLYHKDQLDRANNSVKTALDEFNASTNTLGIKKLAHIGKVFNNNYVSYVANAIHSKHSNLIKKSTDIHTSPSLETSVQKGIPFIGGDLSFETAIEGLSRFLASRIKEELTTYVISKVQDWLRNPGPNSPLNELKVLLPRTVDYLLAFNADQILNFTDEIKQYIEQDFNNLFENLPNLRHTPRIARLLEMHPDMDFAFEALEMIPQLAKIKRPIEYFEILEGSRNIARWSSSNTPLKRNISNAMAMTCLIARSLTTMETGQLELVNLEDIDHYLDNDDFFQLYFGFLHQQNIKYYNANFKIPMGRKITEGYITLDKNKMDESIKALTAALGANPSAIQKKQIEQEAYLSSQDTTFSTCKTCPITLESLMDGVMTVIDSSKIEELTRAKGTFEVILGQLGLRIDKVNSTAVEIRKLNKKGEKVPVELANEFIGEIINFSDEVALASDTLINFLLVQLVPLGNQLDTILIDSTQSNIVYSYKYSEGDIFTRINIYERVEPYISAARSTNQIILDLHQKKYATALLAALEIVSEMIPDNVLTDIDNAIESILNVRNQLDAGELSFFADQKKHAKSPTSFKAVKDEISESAQKLNHFLYKLTLYYRGNYTIDSDYLSLVSDVQSVLDKIAIGNSLDSITQADLDKFNDLATSRIFRNTVISYFANKSIDQLSTDIVAEMKDFVISIKEDTIHLFTNSEADKFKVIFDEYARLSFDWALANKSDRKKYIDSLEAQNEILEQYIIKYAFAFPSKLNIDPNSNLFRLIHFVNDIARSESPEDVEKAIEAFALPSGSFAIKRTAKWNFAINAYPGILVGVQLTQIGDVTLSEFTTSLTVPVGLSLSRGSKKCGSLGIFIPIIDVGALTRLYLDNDTSTIIIPEFNFQSIISPGIYVNWGMPHSPLTLSIGGQYGPNLRRIEDGEEKNYESWRVGIGLTLDIPLLNLFTKPRLDRF